MKLPPYGKPLRAILDSGRFPEITIFIYTGKNSWDKGRRATGKCPFTTLVLPPEASPLTYDWPVQGCSVMIIQTSPMENVETEQFALLLYICGAKDVVAIHPDSTYSLYEKDF